MYIFTISDYLNSYHYYIRPNIINNISKLVTIRTDKKINLCKIDDLSHFDIKASKLSSIDSLQIIESDYFRNNYNDDINIDIIFYFIKKHKNKVFKSLLLL